jgi:hypothetical protein
MSDQDLEINNGLTEKNAIGDDPFMECALGSLTAGIKANVRDALSTEPVDDFQRFLQNMARHADPSKSLFLQTTS